MQTQDMSNKACCWPCPAAPCFLPPPPLTQNMDYTAQQWQRYLQQSQFQKQPPQTTQHRQQNMGASAGKDNWWEEEIDQAWASASKASLYANPQIASHRQNHQQANYRNVPWFRKPTAESPPTPPCSPTTIVMTGQAWGSTVELALTADAGEYAGAEGSAPLRCAIKYRPCLSTMGHSQDRGPHSCTGAPLLSVENVHPSLIAADTETRLEVAAGTHFTFLNHKMRPFGS